MADLNHNLTTNGDSKLSVKSENGDLELNEKEKSTEKIDVSNKDGQKKEGEQESINFFKLFRYASGWDKGYILVGSIFAILLGASFPIIIILMGRLTDTFVQFQIFDTLAKMPDQFNRYSYYESTLFNLSDTTLFYQKCITFFTTYYPYNETSDFHPNTMRARLDLTIPEIVHIYNDSIFQNGTYYVDNFRDKSGLYSLLMGVAAIVFGAFGFFALTLWAQASKNQVHRIKLLFFRSIIHQDISWFDTKTSGDFANKITSDLALVQEGIGDKVGLCIMSFSTVVISLGVAFYNGWELTLVSMAVMPVMAIAFAIIGKIQSRFASSESDAYSKAGAVAEEVINLVRTVYAFGGQEKEIERYNKNIEPARKSGIRRSLFTSLSMGLMWFSIYASYGLSFWYGVKLIIRSIENQDYHYQASTMLIIFFNVLMGTFSIGQTSPYFEAIARACGAGGLIFKIIEQKPAIDSLSPEGVKIKDLKGKVEFRNVHFRYPSRKDVPILRGMHLEAEPGQTVALVGPSGCGKSTIIQLIQRFYDTESGQIYIDGHDIKELNVGTLRDQIGVVGQEPVLFGYSIAENIKLGNPEASMDDIVLAAKEANAYDFIQQLPDKFDTLVGERGGQMSGGQKQRIAIARALVRRPKILLLDESTSALDSESESIVQAALDKASIGRTTFVVAHRLSTIRNAHKIIVVEAGRVRELGTHQELIEAKGIYYNMARLQRQDNVNQQHEEPSEPHKRGPALLRRETSELMIQQNQPKKNEDDDSKAPLPLRRLIKFVMPDRHLLIIATICSFIVGLSIPIYSFVFGEILSVISGSISDMQSQVFKYSMIFVAMGISSGVLNFFQTYLYGISSENLTFRIRKEVFRTILRQEVAWFDDTNNTTGALCARLSNDAASVQGATGSRLSVIAQTFSILLAGVILSMYYCWKLGLVMTAFIPLILISVYFQMKILMGFSISNRKVTEEATKIAVESISNIRTVASLHQELTFWIKYENALDIDFRKSRWVPAIRGLTFGGSQALFNLAYAIALFYGSRLIIDGEIDYGSLFKSTEAVLFGTNMIGQAVAFSPDYQKGKIAAVQIFKLLDRVPKILVSAIIGKSPENCSGEIRFRDVRFRYPTRPEAKILRGISFVVKPGQTVALVGSSGCGKSTCTQLLERFYEAEDGQVMIDENDITGINIPWLRSQIGIVSQEPILFDKTVKDNITYGDNSREVPMDEVVRAAQNANIHKFIQELPMGYETSVGEKGSQLSGGQKQRIAIARALVRNPKILLLDEATSALDSESEKVVQQALDEARQGRTCLVIAHRLSTIQDVDKIVVIEHGQIAEQGTHLELMEKRAIYYQMYTAQCGM